MLRMAGETLTNPADLMQEACDLLAALLPRLRRETPEPSAEGPTQGVIGRHVAAPVPGNPPAFFAYTSIQSSARWAEELLLYAVGASRRDERRGGSDANTVRVLTEVIPKLAAGNIGDDAFRLVISELEQRLNEGRQVRAIDEAEQWRYIRGRYCPYCKCVSLKVLLDAAGRPTGRVECHTWPSVRCADGNGYRPVATMGTDERGVPGLKWADGQWEPAPDLEGQAA